jgi:hypothetical protein
MLIRLRRSEDGMAMVVSMLVVFVVLLLSTVVVARAISSSGTSAYNRSRLQSVNAAEAGLNHFYSHLTTVDVDELSCLPVTETLDTAPGTATFTATPTFYDADGDPFACAESDPTPFNDNVYPAAVLVESQGSTEGEAPRTMQTYMLLTPIREGFQAAIVANGSGGLALTNNMTLNGNEANDADIFVPNGPLTINNQPNLYGNVYVGGSCPDGVTCSLTMSNSSKIWGNAWAYHGIAMSNPASIVGNAISSIGSMTGSGSIGGNATAGGTIAAGGPSGLNVGGTRSPNTTSPAPPIQAFPEIRWVPEYWTNPPDGSTGYTIHTYTSCSAARTFVLSTTHQGNTVVYIDNPDCYISFVNNDRINFDGNLAIVTRGGISMSQRVEWTGVGSKRDLFFMSVWQDSLTYPSACDTGKYNVGDSNNVYYTNVNVSFYSPCTVNIANRSNMSGQVIARNVQIDNSFTMNFKPVLVPGYGSIVGFRQDIVYLREISNA